MERQEFDLIGISVKTTNQNGQMATDILNLWQRFLSENVMEKIPNKIEAAIYSVYTDYEGDHTQPYTVILGCKVKNLDTIPEGLVGKTIPGGNFKKFTAKGNLNEGIVYKTWVDIWESTLKRKYTADYEIYGEKAQNPEDAEVDIFIAVN